VLLASCEDALSFANGWAAAGVDWAGPAVSPSKFCRRLEASWLVLPVELVAEDELVAAAFVAF
jgi:hypothetical protein